MEKDDTITLTELERIAEKIGAMERAYDFESCDVELDQREARIVKALTQVGRMALHNEFKHLNDKIMNHHHVTLSPNHGIRFRKNGSTIPNF